MSFTYRCVFHFSNEGLNHLQKEILKRQFMEKRDKVAEKANEMIPAWNTRFEKIHPERTEWGQSEELDKDYLEFMSRKHERVIEALGVNDSKLALKIDHDNCDIYGYSKSFGTDIHMTLEEM